MEIDFGEAWDFLDDAGRPRHLRFRRNLAPPGDPGVFAETGQLVAVIGDAGRPDNYDEIAISRPDVSYNAIETALHGLGRVGQGARCGHLLLDQPRPDPAPSKRCRPGPLRPVMRQDRLCGSADSCWLSRL